MTSTSEISNQGAMLLHNVPHTLTDHTYSYIYTQVQWLIHIVLRSGIYLTRGIKLATAETFLGFILCLPTTLTIIPPTVCQKYFFVNSLHGEAQLSEDRSR